MGPIFSYLRQVENVTISLWEGFVIGWKGSSGMAMPSFSDTAPFVSSHCQVINPVSCTVQDLWASMYIITPCRGLNLSPAGPCHAMTIIHCISFAVVWQKRLLLHCSLASLSVASTIHWGTGTRWIEVDGGKQWHQQHSRLSFPLWTGVLDKGWNPQLQPLTAS